MPELDLLEGVPGHLLIAQLGAAAGQELDSGKFASPRSSAALAANAFGWFLERPHALPPLVGLEDLDWPPMAVQLERVMRFPWSRGTHPHLDAGIETASCVIGIESKRYEPFLDTKRAPFSSTYDINWGSGLTPYVEVMHLLRATPKSFKHLDAAQLVKHAFGLATEGRRAGKLPVLFYLYAEPTALGDTVIAPAQCAAHREEIARFADLVHGSDVRFAAASWTQWLARFEGDETKLHAERLRARFAPL